MLLNKNYINSTVSIKTCEKIRINKTPGDSPWNHASKKLKKIFIRLLKLMNDISIQLQALEKENTKLSFDTQIGEIKVATGLLIRSRPTFLCVPLSIIARANVQGSTDWRRPVIFRRIRAAHPSR